MKIREEAYQWYFYFIQERMKIFWKRYNGLSEYLTTDPILGRHKFTNVYRAQDRVSQYLIRKVIHEKQKEFDDIDNLLRILIFKIFNNIATWEFLERKLGEISRRTFNVDSISVLLAERISNQPIFSAAYMMTGTHDKYKQYKSKHEKWLRMVDQELLRERRFDRILKAASMNEVYNILLECSFIGEFLAYQYTIDFNYSSAIDFSENSFVKAGIGAIRGIKKCFSDPGKYSFEDLIRFTQDNFDRLQARFGYTEFNNLFGRQPHLIDLQNCFCETDKFLRVKMPELAMGNVRIKQKFDKPNNNSIQFIFPEKWKINNFIHQCNSENTTELTLF